MSQHKLYVLHMLYQNSMITFRLHKVNSTFNVTFKILNLRGTVIRLKQKFYSSEFHSLILIQMRGAFKQLVKQTGKIIFSVGFKDNLIDHLM